MWDILGGVSGVSSLLSRPSRIGYHDFLSGTWFREEIGIYTANQNTHQAVTRKACNLQDTDPDSVVKPTNVYIPPCHEISIDPIANNNPFIMTNSDSDIMAD